MALFQRKPSERLPVYMSDVEFSQVLSIFEAIAPKRCLEWGSGGSTRALLEECPYIERYVAVEHDQKWYENVRDAIDDPRLSLHCILPNTPLEADATRKDEIAWCARAESDPAMFADYIAFPESVSPEYDAVIVDGRARCFCLKKGFELLHSGGALILHDAQRDDYKAAVQSLGRARYFEPFSQGQVCLVRKP